MKPVEPASLSKQAVLQACVEPAENVTDTLSHDLSEYDYAIS